MCSCQRTLDCTSQLLAWCRQIPSKISTLVVISMLADSCNSCKGNKVLKTTSQEEVAQLQSTKATGSMPMKCHRSKSRSQKQVRESYWNQWCLQETTIKANLLSPRFSKLWISVWSLIRTDQEESTLAISGGYPKWVDSKSIMPTCWDLQTRRATR